MRIEGWRGTPISWFILRIFSGALVRDLLSSPLPFGLVVAEFLMQTLGSTGSCREIFTDTTTMILIRGINLAGSTQSTKVCYVPRLLSPLRILTNPLVDIRADSLLEMIKFFTALILNADEATDL